VKETVEQRLLIKRRGTSLLDNHWNPAAGRIRQHFATFPAHRTGTI